MRCNNERVIDLEKRVAYLEQKMNIPVDCGKHPAYGSLMEQYGPYVNKSQAADILSVTRATIYTMLRDGRLTGKMGGSKVSTESIEQFINAPVGGNKLGKKHKHEEDWDEG